MDTNLNIYTLVYIVAAMSYLTLSVSAQSYGLCQTPDKEHGDCVAIQECKCLYKLLYNPNLTDQDKQFLSDSQCGYYNEKVLTCCTDSCKSVEDLLPQPPMCGHAFQPRLLGGKETSIDEFPWIAMLLHQKNNHTTQLCGGTLINNRYVLTAAHCFYEITHDMEYFVVRLGEWDTRTNPDCEFDSRGQKDCAAPHVDFGVEQIIIHPQFVSTRVLPNDIALVRLARPADISGSFIKPICLPNDPSLMNKDYVGTVMDTAGWGYTENDTLSNTKLKAKLTVVDLNDCSQKFRRLIWSYFSVRVNLQPTQMCAGGVQGIDTCRGDSGGPLMVEEKINNIATYYLAGVISFGRKPCGLADWPGVFTRVSSYMDWIKKTIRK